MALINTTTTGILGTTVYGDGAGALTVQQDGVTINKVTTNPVIDVMLSSNQTVTSGVWTKIAFDVKNIDTNSCFNTSNYRFIPNVAGYYSVSIHFTTGSGAIRGGQVSIYKNGNSFATNGNWVNSETYGDDLSGAITRIIYLNGSSDYVEFFGYAYDAAVGSDIFFAGAYTAASAHLVRAI